MGLEDYIMKRLHEYALTPQGKKEIKEKYGIDYGKSNSIAFRECGEKMKEILYRHITTFTSTNPDGSVNCPLQYFNKNDIIVGQPKMSADGKMEINISFREGSLDRDSFVKTEHLENIVLLFTRGYKAKSYVRGYWKPAGRIVKSRISREPNQFLSSAVEEFNLTIGKKAIAELDIKYK